MRTRMKMIAAFLIVLTMAGCGLIPEEEVYQKSPRIQSEVPVEYKLTYVNRGDIADTESIACRYRSVLEETLSFRVGGEFYDGIFVSKGDQVKKGQLLAALQMEPLRDEEKRLDLEGKRLQLLRAQLLDNRMSALERLKLEYAGDFLYNEALIDLEEDYQRRISEMDDQIEYVELRLSELREGIEKRQLIAGIDGTVMYVRTIREWDQSVEGERFIRVSDTTNSVFVGETMYPECFIEGDLMEITIKGDVYPVRVASGESLGIEQTGVEEGKRTEVYFIPLELPPEIEDGDRGQLVVTRAERKDTLYVLSNAIVEIDGRAAVYGLDEYGLKAIRYITTGLRAGSETEILEGLYEGEPIIVK